MLLDRNDLIFIHDALLGSPFQGQAMMRAATIVARLERALGPADEEAAANAAPPSAPGAAPPAPPPAPPAPAAAPIPDEVLTPKAPEIVARHSPLVLKVHDKLGRKRKKG